MQDLIHIIEKLKERGVGFKSLTEGIDTTHSDRGSQYRARRVQDLLIQKGIRASQGLCAYDNAVMESFFGSLKAELTPLGKRFSRLDEAKHEVFEYIEVYYIDILFSLKEEDS